MLTVAEECVLTVDGTLTLDRSLEVRGQLINNNYIATSNTIHISNTGQYSGAGDILFSWDNAEGLDAVFTGVDLSKFEIIDSDFGLILRYTGEEEDDFETNEDGDPIFRSFEELKKLASRTYSDYTFARYYGTEPLVIEEDLSLPYFLQVYAWENDGAAKIVIPEGVTFEAGSRVSAWDVIVEGQFTCNTLDIYGSLIITGHLYNENLIDMLTGNAKLEGAENITYVKSWSKLNWLHATKWATWEEVITKATQFEDEHWTHTFRVGYPIEITESAIVPANLEVDFLEGVTIAEGCTLSLCSYTDVHGPLVVNGTLDNQANLDIWCDEGGMLSITEKGRYMGQGEIYLNQDPLGELETLAQGLDFSQFEVLKMGPDPNFPDTPSPFWKLVPISEEQEKPTEPEETEPTKPEGTEPTEPEPTDPVEPARVAGANRFDTAFVVADQMKANLGVEQFDNIIVTYGANFPDALSGSYLAAVKNAPILLSFNEKYDRLAVEYIRENLNPGGTVYLLGEKDVVSKSFEEELSGFNVKRLAGSNRFETNLKVLEEAGIGDKPILVCTGLGFADSLSASAAKLPILLVWNDLTEGQKELLDGLKGNKLYIIGGESAVGKGMEEQLKAYGEVERVAGGNRFETSVAIAEKFFDAPKSAVLAYAWNFPDGLCGGPLSATMDAPLILTMDKFEAKAAEYVQKWNIKNGIILGGDDLISQETVNNIFN